MKRFLSMLLVFCLALSLAACADGAQKPPQEPAPADPPVSILPAASENVANVTVPDPVEAPKAQFLTAEAEYPVTAQFADGDEAWWNELYERRQQYTLDSGALDGFLSAALPELLTGADEDGNVVCSPLNVYMALAMAAEISRGDSQAQLLALLDADSLETLEERADTLWNACYRDDGVVTSILASSLWMRDDVPCLKGTVKNLRDLFHASSFRGDMSDPLYTEAMRGWLNEQTGGRLADAVENVSLDPETMVELLTTVYFRAKWLNRFDAAATAPETFHAPDGDIECNFLHAEFADFWVYRGERFTAVQQSFENAGDMWFLLPDEGVTPEELLADADAIAFLASDAAEQTEWYYGKLALPKLDVTSELELSDTLKALGVTDLFDPSRADISALYEDVAGVALSKVQHAARLTMDEEGVTATAFTAMGYGAGAPEHEMDFTLDRPFLFKLTAENGLPLFAGVVNHP